MTADVQLVNGSVVLTGTSVIVRSDLIRPEGSPIVLSTRDLFITWSLTRANLHTGAIAVGGAAPTSGDETDDGEHAVGHSMRVEGDLVADDLWLVSWTMTDPQGMADLLELVQKTREAEGKPGDDYLDDDELQAGINDELGGSVDDATKPKLHDYLGIVDASARRRKLPTVIESLRNQAPRKVRREASLLARLTSIEERLDALERRA